MYQQSIFSMAETNRFGADNFSKAMWRSAHRLAHFYLFPTSGFPNRYREKIDKGVKKYQKVAMGAAGYRRQRLFYGPLLRTFIEKTSTFLSMFKHAIELSKMVALKLFKNYTFIYLYILLVYAQVKTGRSLRLFYWRILYIYPPFPTKIKA